MIEIQTQGHDATAVNRFVDLIVERRARKMGLPWASSPERLARNQMKARQALWAAFPAARLVTDNGITMILPGKHDADLRQNPLPDYFITYPSAMYPRAA